jgi:hypothetical protein
MTIGSELVASGRRPTILPNDGPAVWLSGLSVPGHDGFTLVGDADRGNIVVTDLSDHVAQRCPHDIPDLAGIVFDPTGLWEVLGELAVRRNSDAPVDEHGSASDTCCSGVDRNHACVTR